MNFTPKSHGGSVITGILMIAVVGSTGWDSHAAPAPAPITQGAPAPIMATQGPFAMQKSFRASEPVPVVLVAQQQAPANAPQAARSEYYQHNYQQNYQQNYHKQHWYSNKRWWKKNAPIIGGAGGGALIGGLAGGGKGVLIGGAAGAGGGYLVKKLKPHH
jgi:hypothetical protein